ISRNAGKGDERAIMEFTSTAFSMFAFTASLVLLASFFLGQPLAQLFDLSPGDARSFSLVIALLGATVAISFLETVFSVALLAYEMFFLNNLFVILSTLFRSGLIVLYLKLDLGLVGVGYAHLAGISLEMLGCLLVCRKKLPAVQVRLAGIKKDVFFDLISYGAATCLLTLSILLRVNMDSFVITKWINIESVGVYGVAALLIRQFDNLINTGIGVLSPRFSALDGAEDYGRMRSLFQTSMFISAALAGGIAMGLIVLGGQFIRFWVGPEYYPAVPVLWVLTFAYAIALAQDPSVKVLYATNKHRAFALATLVEGGINLVLSILLAKQYGILGVAIGTMIPMILCKLTFQPFYVSKILGISVLTYWKPTLIPLLLAGVGILAGYKTGIMTEWDRFSYSESIVVAIILSAVYGTVILIIGRKHLLRRKSPDEAILEEAELQTPLRDKNTD
ncbi:MAG TPA: oligosaccharide flippase family protein, partial [Candidatus Sumerlaeota bacterium]|nr:oligosaccharide flippase family protein [Candidatus Sumerlaeota bacterium]